MENHEPEVVGAIPTTPEDSLGEAGTRALAEERRFRREAEKLAKSLQTKLGDTERSTNEAIEAITGERDRLRMELEVALQTITDTNIRDTVLNAATAAGAVNAQVVYRYLRPELTIEGGNVTNLEAALKAAKKEVPALFHANGSVDAGAVGPAPTPLDMNVAIRRKAGIG